MACSALCGCACFGGFVTMVSYFGIYGLNNPDAQAWYGVVAGQQTLAPDAATLMDAGVVTPFPVHDKMVSWFLWGFILNLLPFVGCVCMPLAAFGEGAAKLATCVSGLACTAASCGSLMWFITGSVFRFRSDFGYASGDVVPAGVTQQAWDLSLEADKGLFQVSSGRFMWVFLMINYGSMAVSCGCGILAALCGCIVAMFK